MTNRTCAVLAAVLFLTACSAKDVRQPAVSPKEDEVAALIAADRQEFVLPAPPDWRPEDPGRKIKLVLSLEKTAIHPGEKLRYRLTIQNVGTSEIYFGEEPAFMKKDIYGGFYKFIMALPDGSVDSLLPPMLRAGLPHKISIDLTGMTPAQKDAALEKYDAKERMDQEFFVHLQSGESMSTRPDSPSNGPYRTLHTGYPFDKPGAYRIKIVYDATLEQRDHAESDFVDFQVVP